MAAVALCGCRGERWLTGRGGRPLVLQEGTWRSTVLKVGMNHLSFGMKTLENRPQVS